MKLFILFLCVCNFIRSQVISEKIELLYNSGNELIEETHKQFNKKGDLSKEFTLSYRQEHSITTIEYFYDENGRLIKEIFAGQRSISDSLKKIVSPDTLKISIKYFSYNADGKLETEKDLGFECNFRTADIIRYQYKNGLLARKFCTNDCSLKNLGYNYPVYYSYDKNDSLISEQAMGPTDTTKTWYVYRHDYLSLPHCEFHEKYYRKEDSLLLESKTISRKEFNSEGRIAKISFIDVKDKSDSSFLNANTTIYTYNKKGQLLSEIYCKNGKIAWSKTNYKYDKSGNLKVVQYYTCEGRMPAKLALSYYYRYKYKMY